MPRQSNVRGPKVHDTKTISAIIPDVKVGDRDSWDILVRAFRAGLLSKARRLLSSSNLQRRFSPEDLVNETLAKCWQKSDQIQGVTTAQVAKWLLTAFAMSRKAI